MKPVFAISCAVLLAAGCSMQSGDKDFGRRKDRVTPVQPSGCASLDLAACSANSACEASRSVCPGCEATGTCANTTCFVCKDKQPAISTCEGRDEASCNADSLCHANYTEYDCAMVMPLDGGPFVCPAVYTGCSTNLPPQDPCVGLPENACVSPFCRPIYGIIPTIPCHLDGGCGELPGRGYIGCEVNITSCETNCDCAVNEYCKVTLVEPQPMPVVGDAGVARCMALPIPVGVCTPVPEVSGAGGGSGGNGGGSGGNGGGSGGNGGGSGGNGGGSGGGSPTDP